MTQANLTDTPYNFIRRDGSAILLAYGNTNHVERWVPAKTKSPACDIYRIRFRRRWYRFGGQAK